jgi:hypothetical protein
MDQAQSKTQNVFKKYASLILLLSTIFNMAASFPIIIESYGACKKICNLSGKYLNSLKFETLRDLTQSASDSLPVSFDNCLCFLSLLQKFSSFMTSNLKARGLSSLYFEPPRISDLH